MKRIALFAIPVVVAAAIVAFIVTRTPGSDGTDATDQTINTVDVTNGAAANTNAPQQKTDSQEREQVIATARLFAERFGTSRSDDPKVSIENVLPFATTLLAESLTRLSQQSPKAGPVVATTTTALAFSVSFFNASTGRAEVVVTTQRREEITGSQPTVFTQDLRLSFLKEGETWKVNSAIWANRK